MNEQDSKGQGAVLALGTIYSYLLGLDIAAEQHDISPLMKQLIHETVIFARVAIHQNLPEPYEFEIACATDLQNTMRDMLWDQILSDVVEGMDHDQ